MKRSPFSEIWKYKELLYFLAWREIMIRYKQAAFGVAWAIMQPLFAMIIFTLFFGRFAKVPSDGTPYPIFVYCALVPWTYFSTAVGQAANSLVGNYNLITKIYFPRVLLPAAIAVSGLLDFLIGSLIMIVLMAYYGISPSRYLLLGPVLVLAMVALTLSIGMFLAAFNVKYRDVKYAVPFVMQLWLFVTPVIYPTSIVPAKYQTILSLNPLWGLVDGFRAAVFPGHTVNYTTMGTSLAITVIVFVLSAVYFHNTERTFADII